MLELDPPPRSAGRWQRARSLVLLLVTLASTASIPRVRAQDIPDAVRTRMDMFNRALGVKCTHCHVDGAWTDASKPAFGTASNMAQMVLAVNERLAKPDRVACWTCHRGEVRPSRQPRPALDAELEKWPPELATVPESTRITMAVYNVALGVSCDHCHTSDWKSTEKPAMRMAATMNGLFQIFPKFMPATARTQCYMCHKGSNNPPARE